VDHRRQLGRRHCSIAGRRAVLRRRPRAPLDNDFAAGTRFDGITFNAGAGRVHAERNAILLGGPTVLRTLVPPTPIIVGVTNASANLQTVNLGLTLSAGNHTFGRPAPAGWR
jgi:hypothetical protein